MGKIKHQTITSRTDFFYYTFRNIFLVGLPLTLVSALVLSLPISFAVDTSSVDKVVFSLPSSCTLSSVVDVEHADTILNGTYKSGIGQTTLKTFCNDENGYVIYAIGATDNVEGNNVLASSISLPNSNVGDIGNYDIVTGLAENGDTSNWAMKLNYKTGDTSTTLPTIEMDYENKYALIPNDWIKVASRQSGTTDMDKGSNFTTTYAIYTSPTQPAGTYMGQVKFALFHPSNSAKPTTLAQAYKNAGKQKITATDPVTGETGSYYKMQDMTTAICDATNVIGEASQTQLVDIRDNKLYWATKLLDGKCWMTQNLDLDLDSEVVLTSENTDLNDGTLVGAYQSGYSVENGMIKWKPASSTIEFSGSNIVGWSNSSTVPYSASKTDDPGTGHGSWGNYYNWTAAIASNNSVSLTTSTFNNIDNNPQNSVCPSGWRLPVITTYTDIAVGDNDFANLSNFYSDGMDSYGWIIAGPLYFVRSGAIYGSNAAHSNGYYVSSTSGGDNRAYILRLGKDSSSDESVGLVNNIYVNQNYNSRSVGFSVRCVAR